jgi:3-oxoacyl-[acyl-carrier protein] reductase
MFSEAPSTASKIFYPEMVARKSGHIILTGSQAGMVPDWVTEHGPYTSAKAAVHALGTALRPEAEEHGVGVATVIVAGTLTDIVKMREVVQRNMEVKVQRPRRRGRRGAYHLVMWQR